MNVEVSPLMTQSLYRNVQVLLEYLPEQMLFITVEIQTTLTPVIAKTNDAAVLLHVLH